MSLSVYPILRADQGQVNLYSYMYKHMYSIYSVYIYIYLYIYIIIYIHVSEKCVFTISMYNEST